MFTETLQSTPEEADRTDQDTTVTSVDSSDQHDPETQRYMDQLEFMLLSSTPRHNTSETSADQDPSGLLTD